MSAGRSSGRSSGRSRGTEAPVHVVGGGLAGLVAAVTAAERGAPVVLYEAGDRLGGRAVTSSSPPRNLGPHVLLVDGALAVWLRRHRLVLPLARPPVRNIRFLTDAGLRWRPPWSLTAGVVRRLRERAPVDESFRAWARRRFGPTDGEQLCRLAGLFTFHHDPGSLSAGFVWERFGRYLHRPDNVRTVLGGWSTLVDRLAERARSLGVEVELGASLGPGDLPADGPIVVTTPLPVASRLLGEPLTWPGARTALLDLGLAPSAGSPARPSLVMDTGSDLSTCCFLDRVTAVDPSVAPGLDLIQSQLGLAEDVAAEAGFARIDRALDEGMPGWRSSQVWRTERVVAQASGALDPPGTTWRDRPAVRRADGVYLAGDKAAAPGLLSEVSVNSAVRAAHLALDDRRQRRFAVGWPSVALTPEARLQVLAASLPGAAVGTAVVDHPVAEAWPVEPAREVEPDVSLALGPGLVRSFGATELPGGGTRLTVLVANRRRRLLGRLARRYSGRLAQRQLRKLERSSR